MESINKEKIRNIILEASNINKSSGNFLIELGNFLKNNIGKEELIFLLKLEDWINLIGKNIKNIRSGKQRYKILIREKDYIESGYSLYNTDLLDNLTELTENGIYIGNQFIDINLVDKYFDVSKIYKEIYITGNIEKKYLNFVSEEKESLFNIEQSVKRIESEEDLNKLLSELKQLENGYKTIMRLINGYIENYIIGNVMQNMLDITYIKNHNLLSDSDTYEYFQEKLMPVLKKFKLIEVNENVGRIKHRLIGQLFNGIQVVYGEEYGVRYFFKPLNELRSGVVELIEYIIDKLKQDKNKNILLKEIKHIDNEDSKQELIEKKIIKAI